MKVLRKGGREEGIEGGRQEGKGIEVGRQEKGVLREGGVP